MADPAGSQAPSAGPDPGPEPTMLEVGRILRAHGLAGEVVVHLWSNRPGRLAPGSVLWSRGAALTVVASRPNRDRHLVRFDGIGDRSSAEGLRGCLLEAPIPPIPPSVGDPDDAEPGSGDAEPAPLWVHELVGAEVVDLDDAGLGTVVAMEENPASDLLVLDSGALVPLRFVVGWVTGGRLRVDAPPGLISDPTEP